MKLFVDLGEQLLPEYDRAFAFYCTVRGQFDSFLNGEQVFESIDQFEEMFIGDFKEIRRYLDLIPSGW